MAGNYNFKHLVQLEDHLKAFPKVKHFVEIVESLCEPAHTVLFPGTPEAYHEICQVLVEKHSFVSLNPYLHPNSYLARSDVRDVERSDDKTIVCPSPSEADLYAPDQICIEDPNGNWKFNWGVHQGEYDPHRGREFNCQETRETMYRRFRHSMHGRVMYVVPFCMGPATGPFTKLGVQVTDSPYVVANMYILARTGIQILEMLRSDHLSFVPCWHSLGMPLHPGDKQVPWPQHATERSVCCFTSVDQTDFGRGLGFHEMGPYSIMSYGSQHGGFSFLFKEPFSLRIASHMGAHENPEQPWMAEHMLIIHVQHRPKPTRKGMPPPPPRDFYLCGGFPTKCGKRNVAMLSVPKEFQDEWSVSTLGDDIAWLRINDEGRLVAVNPETGFYAIAPGLSYQTDRHTMDTMRQGGCIFTNCAATLDGRVWWRDLTQIPPDELIDHRAHRLRRTAQNSDYINKQAALPGARYTVPISQCPILDKRWNDPQGVPVDAFIFGGRRSTTHPIALRTRNWEEGVLFASCMRSEKSYEPFSMRCFVGYNFPDYFQHWLNMGARLQESSPYCPGIYTVNWFRKSTAQADEGGLLWPGFSHNFRVLKWICECSWAQRTGGPLPPQTEAPIGFLPSESALLERSDLGEGELEPGCPTEIPDELLAVNKAEWLQEMQHNAEFLSIFRDRLPAAMWEAHRDVLERIEQS